MPWIYHQRNGALYRDGAYVGHGYSGIDQGKDNPDMQSMPDIGPIPRGTYAIGAPFHHVHAGSYAMRLTPSGATGTYGRAGFMIHGDSIAHPGHASNGCIVLNLDVRKRIWESGDRTLEVVY